MPPTPLAFAHVNVGWTASAAPNWSKAVAANCCVPLGLSVTAAGLTVTVVAVWLTFTLRVLVVCRPAASVIVTVKTYGLPLVLAWVNVAVACFAALVPLAENVTGAGPV